MANITRIKNNQITDSTITYTKIASGTLVGSVFNPDLTLSSNVTILGNLSVSGNSSTINSVNTYINDPTVTFNNGYTGSLSGYDIGIVVNRNWASLSNYGAVNTAFVWNENQQAFLAITSTTSGNNIVSLTNSGFANTKVGNLTSNSVTVTTGTIVATAGGVQNTPIGSATTNTGAFTTLTSSGTTIASGNIVAASGTASTSATTGALVVVGGAGVSGNATIGGDTIITGDAYVQGGDIWTSATTFNLVNATATTVNFAGAATTLNTGNASGTTNMAGVVKTNGNLVAASGTASTTTSTGALVVTGGAGITGAIYAGSLNATVGNITTLVAPNFSSSNAQVTGTGSYVGTGASLVNSVYATTGYLTNLFSGNITGNFNQASLNGTVPTANVSLYDTVAATTTNATFYPSIVDKATGNVSNYTQSAFTINPSTGTVSATQFSGTGNFTTAVVTNFSSGNVQITGGSISGISSLGATTLQATNFSTGNAVISGGYISAVANIGATFGTFTNFATANAVITGGSINGTTVGASTASTGAFTTLTASGATTVTNATAATTAGTGALVVTGGIGVAKDSFFGGNVNIGGNLTVTGSSVTISSASLSIQDPIINLHSPNDLSPLTSNDTFDIGLKLHYFDTVDSAAFVGRANDTGYLEWYSRGTDVGNIFTSGVYGTIKSGEIILANTTPSTSSGTGAIRTSGGLGVAGAIYAAGLNATTGNITTLASTNFSTANAVITGGSTTGMTNGSYTTLQATNFSTGNAQVTGTGSYVGTGASLVNSVYATTGYLTNLFSSNITGNFNQASLNGTVPTANVSLYDSVTASSANSTFYPQVIDKATGNAASYSVSSFTVNPSTGVVNATQFAGAGNFTTAVVTNFSTGNAQVTGGSTTGMTNGSYTTLQATNFSSGNIQVTGGSTTGMTNGSYTTLQATNFSSGNAVISGGYISALTNATITTTSITSETVTNLNTSNIVVTGGYLRGLANVQAVNGTFSGVTTVGGNLVANSTTNSTSTTTGALTVVGGAGIMSNVFIGGSTTLGSNRAAGYDTITQGVNDATLIWARSGAAYDQVLIGNSATASTLVRGAKLQINSTDSILLPSGTNAQRPSSAGGTDTTGMFRYNTTISGPEYYNGTAWQALTSLFTVITDEQYAGDASTVNFTMAGTTTTAATIVSINGVLQIPTLAYSVSGTTLTFTEAPASGDVIDVRRLTTTATVTQISSTNGYMQFVVDNNGAYVYTGSASTAATTYWDTSGAKVTSLSNVSVASANTLTTIDSFSATTYRSAKYVVQATQGSNYQVSEVLVLHNGTTATRAMFGVIDTGSNVGVTAATLSGGTVALQYIAAGAGTNVRITKDYVLI